MTAQVLLMIALRGAPGAGDVVDAVAPGDAAFASIDYASALQRYGEALASHPREPEILWRMARAWVCMAEVEEGPARAEHLARAESSARECIRADSLAGEGHTWLSAALGYLALEAGTSRKIELSSSSTTCSGSA